MSEHLTEADRQRLTDWWWTNFEAAPGNAEELHALVEGIVDAALEAAAQAIEAAADSACQCPDLRCHARISGIESAARIVRAQKRGA